MKKFFQKLKGIFGNKYPDIPTIPVNIHPVVYDTSKVDIVTARKEISAETLRYYSERFSDKIEDYIKEELAEEIGNELLRSGHISLEENYLPSGNKVFMTKLYICKKKENNG